MSKKDAFDLDLQISKSNGGVEPRITSVALCTPGTCHNGCKDNTLASKCCPSRYTACVTKTCITCV